MMHQFVHACAGSGKTQCVIDHCRQSQPNYSAAFKQLMERSNSTQSDNLRQFKRAYLPASGHPGNGSNPGLLSQRYRAQRQERLRILRSGDPGTVLGSDRHQPKPKESHPVSTAEPASMESLARTLNLLTPLHTFLTAHAVATALGASHETERSHSSERAPKLAPRDRDRKTTDLRRIRLSAVYSAGSDAIPMPLAPSRTHRYLVSLSPTNVW